MEIAPYMRALGTFVPMEVHIGMLLRELYLDTGVKMARFASAINHSPKTIYYHFGQEHLNTSILEAYEIGLKSLGRPVDIWELISRKRKGEDITRTEPSSMVSEPPPQYQRSPSVADLLRQAADQLEKERPAPAPDRDKERR